MSRENSHADFEPDTLFPIPIWSRKIVDHERINTKLIELCAALEANTESMKRSNSGGWHSHNRVHALEECSEIVRIISLTCIGCAKHMEFDFDNFELVIKEMWLNKNGRGNFNKIHLHPNSILSGTYYVKTPEDCGNIEFHDPIAARMMNIYPVKKRKSIHMGTIDHPAKAGTLLLFPSWLQHSVQPNLSDDYRISLSFNISYKAAKK